MGSATCRRSPPGCGRSEHCGGRLRRVADVGAARDRARSRPGWWLRTRLDAQPVGSLAAPASTGPVVRSWFDASSIPPAVRRALAFHRLRQGDRPVSETRPANEERRKAGSGPRSISSSSGCQVPVKGLRARNLRVATAFPRSRPVTCFATPSRAGPRSAVKSRRLWPLAASSLTT